MDPAHTNAPYPTASHDPGAPHATPPGTSYPSDPRQGDPLAADPRATAPRANEPGTTDPRAADPRIAGYEGITDTARPTDAHHSDDRPDEAPTTPSGPHVQSPPAQDPYGQETPAQDPYTQAPHSTPHPAPASDPPPPPTLDDTPTAQHTVPGPTVCAACSTGVIAEDGYCENCGHAQPRVRDHFERELPGVAAASDRGHRHHRNEDFFAVAGTALPDGAPAVIAVVCDGVSSAVRPDDASAAASEAASRSLLAALPQGTHPQQALHEAIVTAAKAVSALAHEPHQPRQHDPHRHQNAPACTFVGTVVGGGLLTVGWVGDSRAYWIPDDRGAPAARLTEDDSWAAQMVANRLMSEAEAYADDRAHAITGWLGADAYELDPHTASFEPDGPGVVVVCTDGLWNYAESAAQMAAAVPADARIRPLHGARTLVRHALDGGGHDNVTVAVVPFPAR
ncbi:protein phosphatase 2C domain-containing protein [Streptomyces sp. NPDC003077]|uniref:protein phosphatase 2C domain-containing protein n=1 Tax=Streptomyces sp. NPDC003077 TaxID=3154443 RepID=UPI0033B82AE8